MSELSKPYARQIPESWEIPEELHGLPIWCCWRLVQKPGDKKPDKVPVSPLTDASSGWNNATGFCTTLDRAIGYANEHKHLNGVAVVLRQEHGLAGGDLDSCMDAETGVLTDKAQAIISEADTYTEISPGLCGLRFIARGSFGGHTGNDRANGVEFYEDNRFLTITGNQLPGTPFAIEQRDLTALGEKYFPERNGGCRQNGGQRDGRRTPDGEIRAMLQYINNDGAGVDYDEWQRIGGAVHNASEGDGYELWVEWSARSDKHDESDMRRKWDSFGKHSNPTTVATLRYLARRGGWSGAGESPAEQLAERITNELCEALLIDPDAAPEEVKALEVKPEAIHRMLNRSFWSGSKSKLFILNDASSVNQYTEKDAWQFLCRACGGPINRENVMRRARAVQPLNMKPDQIEKAAAAIASIPKRIILSELKWRNQRDHMQWRVDMFAKHPRMELLEDAARIILPHAPFPDHGEPDPEIIADFQAHFAEVREVLGMVAAARFAGDRKKAYLWILAASDWGKGFFTACLHELGLVVEMSVKEIERVFEGQPAGKRPEEFKRAWVLAVNEFKSVKAEIKQLESRMQIAPKNMLTSEVELFAKLFLSAESVASLVTDHGVEDQFLKRFSLITKSGSIEDKPLFSRDPGAYRRAVVAWIARVLNAHVRAYQAMGRETADRRATEELREFHHRFGLGNFQASFSDSMSEVAEEFRDWLNTEADLDRNLVRARTPSDGADHIFLRNASKVLETFLRQNKADEQVPAIKRRKDDIFAALSSDGRGNASHRIIPAGRASAVPQQTRAVKLHGVLS